MTPTQLKVLRQAVHDGGRVEFDGLDKHPGWGQRERTAAAWLHAEGLGEYHACIPYKNAFFAIWPAGRKVLKEHDDAALGS